MFPSSILSSDAIAAIRSMSSMELYRLAGSLPTKIIDNNDDNPYLERHFIEKFTLEAEDGCTQNWYAYLHRFVSPTGDAESESEHSHPWEEAYSEILHGGYNQRVGHEMNLSHVDDDRFYSEPKLAGSHNILDGKTLHKITACMPGTLTLFIHSDWKNDWGFVKDGVIEMRKSSKTKEWWHDAPLGNDCNRQPYQNPLASKLPQLRLSETQPLHDLKVAI